MALFDGKRKSNASLYASARHGDYVLHSSSSQDREKHRLYFKQYTGYAMVDYIDGSILDENNVTPESHKSLQLL
jgi:hypothetical protein